MYARARANTTLSLFAPNGTFETLCIFPRHFSVVVKFRCQLLHNLIGSLHVLTINFSSFMQFSSFQFQRTYSIWNCRSILECAIIYRSKLTLPKIKLVMPAVKWNSRVFRTYVMRQRATKRFGSSYSETFNDRCMVESFYTISVCLCRNLGATLK